MACRALAALAPLLLTACATLHPQDLAPFRTDGCSLYPDRNAQSDWCDCCVAHDLAYWRGGDAAARLQADEALRACVLHTTGNAQQAAQMFSGVRAGGGPWWPTSYRWAYGWPYGRGHAPLDSAERERADTLQRQAEQQGALACPSRLPQR
ncbi:hypothetical protein [Inhella sp.]|uniref:hypothetical protein n=1 Tax=Inhella sp. TaxID=1921806 RepID=UPI0035B25A4C